MKMDFFEKMKICFSIFVVVLLVGLVVNTSYSLLSNSIVEKLGVDEKTSDYISFNYSANDKRIFQVKAKPLSDFRGKRIMAKNYFDFSVLAPRDYDLTKEMYYEIVLTAMSDEIEAGFIKVYLTDQNNKPVEGFSEVVPVMSALADGGSGKIIYTGSFKNNNLEDKYRLRIWVSNKYNKKTSDVLAYQVQVRVKE